MDNRQLKAAGIWSLVMGIVTLVSGISTGVLLIVTSAQIFKSRK